MPLFLMCQDDGAFASAHDNLDYVSASHFESENFNLNTPVENKATSHSISNNPISYRVNSDFNYISDREKFFKYAIEIYDNEEWNAADIAFHTYLSESPWILPERTEVYYYLAKLALNQGDYFTAIRMYEKFFIFSGSDSFLENAEYEYALCQLTQSKLKANELFQTIAQNENHQYYDEARSIIGVIP